MSKSRNLRWSRIHASNNVQHVDAYSFPPNCNCHNGIEMSATGSTRKSKKILSEGKKTTRPERASSQVGSKDVFLLALDVAFYIVGF